MKTLKLFLISTPSWVYCLLLYYIWSEIKSSKDILIQLKKIFIAPIILLLLFIQNLLTLNEIDIFIIYSCLISIFIGITTSYLIIIKHKFTYIYNFKNNELKIPYSKVSFIYMLLLFFSTYYFKYLQIIDKSIFEESIIEELYISLFAILAGLFIGKSMGYLYNFKKLFYLNIKNTHLLSLK
ncbi:hypothetical protein [Rickettsiales endosymbiont of Trichoplax sp. H2]|uniref:hypothetical protein n=1 Tax=Rickettsiales endosymbiont of Trichoplax sp. H2 TaxID=2021221 RepID=UPI0012B33C14|nr:hypothetical protein [Rickettsiales endosymbiont of Trichoplax sp. H2]